MRQEDSYLEREKNWSKYGALRASYVTFEVRGFDSVDHNTLILIVEI